MIGMDSRNEIAVAMNTPNIPIKVLPLGDIRMMEIRLPGEAGATSPKSVNVKKESAQTLPIIIGRSNIGRART